VLRRDKLGKSTNEKCSLRVLLLTVEINPAVLFARPVCARVQACCGHANLLFRLLIVKCEAAAPSV
jgi:hypothetical protein